MFAPPAPPGTTRRLAETAAHLADHVFPRLPVRQWVLSVPKRLRYFLQRDGAALNTALRIFLRVVQHSLVGHCPGAARSGKAALRIGAVVAQVQADARKRILRAFVRRGLIEADDAKEMAGYQHGGGFSVDAGVCIAATDRAGLERLLRYCARPPFAMERLRKQGADLVYQCPEPQSGGKCADLVLTPLELIAKIAALVPPPRTHRHRYFWCAGTPRAAARSGDGHGTGAARRGHTRHTCAHPADDWNEWDD